MQYFHCVHMQNYKLCLEIFSTFSDGFFQIFKHLVSRSWMRGELVGSLKSAVKITRTLGISSLSGDFTSIGRKRLINFHLLKSPQQTKFYLRYRGNTFREWLCFHRNWEPMVAPLHILDIRSVIRAKKLFPVCFLVSQMSGMSGLHLQQLLT